MTGTPRFVSGLFSAATGCWIDPSPFPQDTVNAALAEVIALAGRRALIARLVEGGLPDLLDDEVMAAAWRQ